jgi:hypothetical protein
VVVGALHHATNETNGSTRTGATIPRPVGRFGTRYTTMSVPVSVSFWTARIKSAGHHGLSIADGSTLNNTGVFYGA